jgi:thiol:disulfide interchange protein DsbA
VVEFFWYSCPHCNAFEPQFEAWAKAPAHVVVRRVPVAFNASFVPQQKLYYALEAWATADAMHAKVFRAIHVERNKLATDDAIFDWVGKQGVDLAKFKEIYNSFTVANQARKAGAAKGIRRGRRARHGRGRPLLHDGTRPAIWRMCAWSMPGRQSRKA